MEANANGGQNNTPPNEPNVTLSSITSATNLNHVSNVPTPPAHEPQQPVEPVTPPVDNNPPVQPATVPPVDTPPVNEIPETIESYEDIIKVLNSSSDHSLKADIFGLFKATKSDDKGNLLNDEGKVVLSAEKFKDFVENDNLPLNEGGEAVNELGEVIRSKEQLLQDTAVIIPIQSAIETNFGIKFSDTSKFTDNTEGIVNLISESLKQLNVGAVRTYLDSNPELKGFAQHLALGGSVDTYSSSNINYKDINIKNLDESSKIDFIKKSFALQGNNNSEGLINLIKQAGEDEVNKYTANALIYLDGKQTETNKLRDEQLKQQHIAEQNQIKDYWTNVENIIQKGDLKLINIPVKERQGFFEYISKPINDKMDSAESLDMQKDSTEFDLMVSYLRYKKGDLSQLVNNLSSTDRVKKLSDKIKKYNSTINGSGVPITTSTSGKDANITIEKLLKQGRA